MRERRPVPDDCIYSPRIDDPCIAVKHNGLVGDERIISRLGLSDGNPEMGLADPASARHEERIAAAHPGG